MSKTFDFGDGPARDIKLSDIDSTADDVVAGRDIERMEVAGLRHTPGGPFSTSPAEAPRRGWNWTAIGVVISGIGIVVTAVIALV